MGYTKSFPLFNSGLVARQWKDLPKSNFTKFPDYLESVEEKSAYDDRSTLFLFQYATSLYLEIFYGHVKVKIIDDLKKKKSSIDVGRVMGFREVEKKRRSGKPKLVKERVECTSAIEAHENAHGKDNIGVWQSIGSKFASEIANIRFPDSVSVIAVSTGIQNTQLNSIRGKSRAFPALVVKILMSAPSRGGRKSIEGVLIPTYLAKKKGDDSQTSVKWISQYQDQTDRLGDILHDKFGSSIGDSCEYE